MISKNTVKLIKSLSLRKYRQQEKMFLVEGDKNVAEVLQSHIEVNQLFAAKAFLAENTEIIKYARHYTEVLPQEIKKASLLKNPQNCLAICKLPQVSVLPEKLSAGLSLYLDNIQDPGNLGTIIRICDWFGIENLFCSTETTDMYNHKVIQASMGSFCRVKVCYSLFEPVEKLALNSKAPILGTFLTGKNVYSQQFPPHALLVMGNEGNGISSEVEKSITEKITIPNYSGPRNTAESLNVAIATGIICAEFKRQNSP